MVDQQANYGFKIFGWLLLSSSALFSQSSDLTIAIHAAQDYLGDKSFQVVSDKFHFLQELSTQPSSDTFHAVDVGILADRYSLWKKYLPSVVPHYAVKANNDVVISQVLAKLGTGFDCASVAEIKQILALGVDPSRIVFANPRKSDASIQYAMKNGVHLFTFDSIEELDKICGIDPEANLLLRTKTDDSHSIIPLSHKFGATLDEAYEILDHGFMHNAHIVGVAFHVGSNCTHVESYEKAILDAAALFQYSQNRWEKTLSILDIGGGWPGTEDESFVEIAQKVDALIHTQFSPETRFIAEPGRFFAAKTTTLAMRVIGKKRLSQNKVAYYLSTGVYGFFMSSLYYEHNLEKIGTEGWRFKALHATPTRVVPSLLWGPTCDSGDKILEEILLPEIETGDFFVIENLGAYSKSLETGFNGIPPSIPYYICEYLDENYTIYQK